ncbi:hypothetical protein PMSD_28120 [Paenibacillus macquariensis subsp. defensor]|nr:hypothetical protein PMSD_28120 [Paenibacillus macquariensis subsp. defensor]
MTVEERKKLRNELLKGLYDCHFEKNGNGKKLDDSFLKEDTEVNLAYLYLVDKGYVVKVSPGGRITVFSINSRGIDLIESEEKKSDFFS